MTVQDLFNDRKYFSVWKLARYFYRIGDPILTDRQYEIITDYMKTKRNLSNVEEYLNRTYDDDPIPYDLLKLIGVEPVEISSIDKTELFSILDEDKSMSCDSVTEYKDAYEFFNKYRMLKKDLMVSLKVDGINTKTLYLNGKLELSLSRGRSAVESFDFTKTIKNILPKTIKDCPKELKIVGDSYVDVDGLFTLRNEIDKDKYKTAKSAAISLLRVNHDYKYYKHLHTCVFSASGLANTLSETFIRLEELGFEVVPNRLIKYQEIPADFESFKIWLKSEVFDYIYDKSIGIPSDGIVVEVNDLLYEGDNYGQYSTRQLALKFEQWAFKYYKGIVKDIIWTQKRVHASLRIEIEPIETLDGCKAQFVNVYNPSILIKNDIYVGQPVLFERNSGAVNVLIHGQRLDGIMEKSE